MDRLRMRHSPEERRCLMTAKEYLSQAHHIDLRINSKLEQVKSLRSLAQKATATWSDVPMNGTRNISRMSDIITRMVDLQNEIDTDITGLLNLRQEIAAVIRHVDNHTYQTLLELRYLCFKSWDDIAAEMGYERRYILKVHDRAVQKVDTKRHIKTVENHIGA